MYICTVGLWLWRFHFDSYLDFLILLLLLPLINYLIQIQGDLVFVLLANIVLPFNRRQFYFLLHFILSDLKLVVCSLKDFFNLKPQEGIVLLLNHLQDNWFRLVLSE